MVSCCPILCPERKEIQPSPCMCHGMLIAFESDAVLAFLYNRSWKPELGDWIWPPCTLSLFLQWLHTLPTGCAYILKGRWVTHNWYSENDCFLQGIKVVCSVFFPPATKVVVFVVCVFTRFINNPLHCGKRRPPYTNSNRKSSATQSYKVHGGSFRVSVIHPTLTWWTVHDL